MNKVIFEYKQWLFDIVYEDRPRRRASYTKLLDVLFEVDFEVHHPYDENREVDGEELRWMFVHGGGDQDIYKWKRPCTILEMLIALSFKMYNMTEGSDESYSPGYWFWDMIANLGLDDQSNSRFSRKKVLDRLHSFNNRLYLRDGRGGNIFILNDSFEDLRDKQIWWQMCHYLDEKLF